MPMLYQEVLAKGGPGSGPHPGHAAAGDKSSEARAATMMAGGSGKGSSVKLHEAAVRAHYAASRAYQKLADAHESAARQQEDKADRSAEHDSKNYS